MLLADDRHATHEPGGHGHLVVELLRLRATDNDGGDQPRARRHHLTQDVVGQHVAVLDAIDPGRHGVARGDRRA